MDPRDIYRNTLNRLATHYLVPDIVPQTARMIFLLESPHIQELRYMAPVSGSSGVSMTKHLFGQVYGSLPLGRLLKDTNDASLLLLGLMNVCQIPLQGAAYEEPIQREHQELFSLLERVRTQNNTSTFADGRLNSLQGILTNSLAKRLSPLQDRQIYIVPCGRFAQKFFRMAGISSPSWTIVPSVPHPSYNNFDKPMYSEPVQALKLFFHNMMEAALSKE